MAFFSSRKDPKIKRSYSTERINSRPTESTSSSAVSVPPIRIRSTSRPATIYDPHSVELHMRGADPEPPTPKLKTRPSLRRIPVPTLSIQDLHKLTPNDRPHTSPTILSSHSTSDLSRKSSIVDVGGASGVTTTNVNPDHFKSSTDTRTSTPPRSPPNNWESPGSGSRNPVGASDLNKSLPPIINSLIWVSSPKQVPPPMHSPNSASQKPPRAVLRRKSSARPPPKTQPILTPFVSSPLPLDAAHLSKQSTSDERTPRSPGIPLPPSSPRDLTPAGAVVAAYKEQEKRRKHPKDFVGPNTNGQPHRESHDGDGGVYYTVFGSSGKVVAVGAPEEERRSRCDLGTYSNKSKSISRKPSLGALGRLSRKTSTKFKKAETVNASGVVSESENGHERVTRDGEAGRLSFQGRRSASLPGKHRRKKSLGISVDNPNAGLISDSPQSTSTPSKSGGWSLDDASPSASGKLWKLMKRISTGGLREKYNVQEAAPPVPALPEGLLPIPPPKHKPSPRSAPQSPNRSNPPTSRYVRGRSSFGDAPFTSRRRETNGAPSLLSSHRSPTLSSGKNPSHHQPSTNTRSSSPVSSGEASSKYWHKSRSSSVSTFENMPPLPGRIVTSGPILSPVELHKLEKEQPIGDLSSPPSTVDSHSLDTSPSNHHGNAVIIVGKPSLRGLRVRASGEDSETDGMSTSEFVALPSPPRHHYKPNPHAVYHQSNDSGPTVGSVSTSPTIPMFLTEDAVNRFRPTKGSGGDAPRSPSQTSRPPETTSNDIGAAITTQPPPRPQRSSKRKPLTASQRATVRASQDREPGGRDGYRDQVARPMTAPSHPRDRSLGSSLEFGDRSGEGRSCGTFGNSQSMGLVQLVKTSQDSSSSRENLRPKTSYHSRTPLKFREMESGESWKDRKALTEKEKVDKWDDLLEKSERAGGTIHIDIKNTKLLSDTLRFSDYSTLTLAAI